MTIYHGVLLATTGNFFVEQYTSIKQITKGLFIKCGNFKKLFTSLYFASTQLELVVRVNNSR